MQPPSLPFFFRRRSLLVNQPTPPPIEAPMLPTAAVTEPPAASRLPVAPTACKVATAEPAATPPPLAIAADDIIEAATEPTAMPPDANPAAATATGAPATATPVPSAATRGISHLFLPPLLPFLPKSLLQLP